MAPPVKWPTFQVILKYFQLVMAFVYILLGAIILLKSDLIVNNLPSGFSIPLGIILVAYGIVRGFRAYQRSL